MVVKQVFDHSLRAYGKRFLSSLKASNRYSEGYLASLETTVAMVALYAEEQAWPDVQEITTEHLEEYLAYLQDRVRWFGERTYAEPRKLSKGHINAQYRRLNRFFNWLVERGLNDQNPMLSISAPKLEEKTVPVVTEGQMRDLLTLTEPSLARTPAHRFRLVRDRALLYAFWDTPGRLAEIAKLRTDDVDLAEGTLLVMGKGRKERRMPIGDSARSVLWDYLQERETLMPHAKALWVSEQGEPLLPNGICQILKRLAKRANIEDMHPHKFWHSYAVNALRAGMPEQVLKIVGGWKKIPETYFRTLGEEDAREFHRQVSPGDRLGGRGRMDYTLSPGVDGLSFDAGDRTLSGTPLVPGGTEMTYTVTDANDVSDSRTFTITVVNGPTAPSSAPGSLEAAQETSSPAGLSASATWDAVTGATGYVVQVIEADGSYPDKPVKSAPDGVVLTTLTDGTSHWVVISAISAGDYKVRVAARNADGVGPWSEEVSFTVRIGGV